MSLLVDTNYNNAISSADYVSRNEKSDHYFGDEYLGHATSRTNSSDKGQRLGIATFGDVGYIAMYADNSTEEDPIVKVGDYEVRIKDVDPNNATRLEMFALLSYMDKNGLTNNHGMSSYSKMMAYSSQAEANGFCSGLEEEKLAFTQKRDWISILNNAKDTFLSMSQTYNQALNIEKMIFSLIGKTK